MSDNGGKTKYWLDLAADDLSVADLLFKGKKRLHMAFFCHLAAEKALKAAIAHNTEKIPPKIHDLLKLAKFGEIYDCLTEEQLSLLEELTPLNIDARYPAFKESIELFLTIERCKKFYDETEAFLCWIKSALGK